MEASYEQNNISDRNSFRILAVYLGAFGAHGLEKLVDADAIQTWETGVTYQMYHALFLLVLANVNQIPEAIRNGYFTLS